MNSNHPDLARLCHLAASYFRRGYAFGSTGNLSVRAGDVVWVTPTGRSLENLQPEDLACLGLDGTPFNDNHASKEAAFHLGCYQAAGSRCGAIVHLHSTHAVALSCLDALDPARPLPVITPYYLMRVAPLALVPYHRPGSEQLAAAVVEAATGADCLLMRHHGLVTLGRTLEEAADRAEELEESARLYFLLRGERVRELSTREQDEIIRIFRSRTG